MGSGRCAYKTASGRREWLSRDPIAEDGGINLYAYCAGDPINCVDPNGMWGIQFGGTNIGYGDPTLQFDQQSWFDLERGSFATIDGLIPFGDPFMGGYDPCNSFDQRSRNLGSLGRDFLLMAGGVKAAQLFGKAILSQTGLAEATSFSQQMWLGRFAIPMLIANSSDVFGGGVMASVLVKTTEATLAAGATAYVVDHLASMFNKTAFGFFGAKPFGNKGLESPPE